MNTELTIEQLYNEKSPCKLIINGHRECELILDENGKLFSEMEKDYTCKMSSAHAKVKSGKAHGKLVIMQHHDLKRWSAEVIIKDSVISTLYTVNKIEKVI